MNYIFIKRKKIQLNDYKILYKNELNNVKNVVFYFLGKKYDKFEKLKLYQLLNLVYGINLKRYTLFFSSQLGYIKTRFSLLLSLNELHKLQTILRQLFVEYELLKAQLRLYDRKIQINIYQGIRHKLFLPSRGQRTKTNAGTLKQKRKNVNILKKHENKTYIRIRKRGEKKKK